MDGRVFFAGRNVVTAVPLRCEWKIPEKIVRATGNETSINLVLIKFYEAGFQFSLLISDKGRVYG